MVAIVRDNVLVASAFQALGNTGRQNYDIIHQILFQNYKNHMQIKGLI